MPSPKQPTSNLRDLINIHPTAPPKSLPQKMISFCCFPYPRKASKALPVLDPRYNTFEALAASNRNPQTPLSPSKQQSTYANFERGSTGTYSRFPTLVYESDDRARYAQYDFYPSGACREQVGWHPHGEGILRTTTTEPVHEDKRRSKQKATAYDGVSDQPAPTTKPPESSQATNLQHRQHRQPATDNQPQRIVTDHFLSFSTAASDDEEPASNISPPAKPLPSQTPPQPPLPLRLPPPPKPAMPPLPHRHRSQNIP